MTARRSRTVAALLCAVAIVSSCGSGDDEASPRRRTPRVELPPPTVTTTLPQDRLPPPVPATGAYLGVWSNPSELARHGALQSSVPLDTSPAVRHLYVRFTAPPPVVRLRAIAATNAVPLLSWGCAPEDDIASGAHDAWIRSYATALAEYAAPVFLRYAWEMNLAAPRRRCGGMHGPAGFVAAWRRIRTIFQEAGATNVAFVWCPGAGAGAGSTPGAQPATGARRGARTRRGAGAQPDARMRWDAFFPGADAVDWIGVDGYVRDPNPRAAPSAFGRIFGAFYERFHGYGKPLMIAETGARPRAQPGYLSNLARLLPARYPQVKALLYFDAAGPRGDWSLTVAGRHAFASLAANPYFSFRAPPSA